MRTLGIVVLLLIVGAGTFVFWRVRTAAQRGGMPFSQLSVAQKHERRADAERLTEQVDSLARSARRHEHRRFSLPVSQDQLNTLLQDRLKINNVPVHDPRVSLDDGTLTLLCNVSYNGLDPVISLEGKVLAEDGKLALKIKSLKIDGLLNAPRKWRRTLERTITPRLNSLLARAPGRVDRVTIETGRMTLEGQTD